MIQPSFEDFSRLARQHTLVPVVKSVAADLLTPVSAFLAVASGEPNAFLLESVEGGEKIGRYTFLGVRPYMTVTGRGKDIFIHRGKKRERAQGDLFETVRKLLREHSPAQIPGLPPFTAGAVGFFSYDVVRNLESLPSFAKDDLQTPECVLMFFDRVLAFDHLRHEIHIIAAADVTSGKLKKAYDGAVKDIAALEKKLASGLRIASTEFARKARPAKGKLKVHASTTQRQYESAVNRAKEYIAAGDIFQVVLSQRMDFEPGAKPFDVYRALRTVNPSPYMYFLRMGNMHVLGSSPELLVRVTDRKLEYRPIAGTRPRGSNEAEDVRLSEELRKDEKELAEHVMLVDLGRNDLGRVSEYGSVRVRELMYIERYSHVMHIVSAIEGKLRDGLDAIDAFASCFPAGTLTGAPKVRAMEIIEELEPVRRGVYGGSVMYADFAGNLDSCIAIRTMFMKGKKAYVQAGAGLVADSVPEREYQECVNKARAVVRAVELARGDKQ
ncbi:MAG TPA: anthranilate synthase component I [Terriglobales bacterium]|nr:anthranilate synthase component I [Terriglobales bacterium]